MTSTAQEQPAALARALPIAHIGNGTAPAAAALRPVQRMPKPRRMTLERWRNWTPADGWKYDWNNGIISKSKKMVSREQRYISSNLMDAFYEKGLNRSGTLMPEAEMAYDNLRYRVPDLAYFTQQQTLAAAKGERDGVAAFVIEIISGSDSGTAIEEKMWEYFANGVQVVWHIWPSLRVVKVYTAPLESKSLIGGMVCSAAPALPEFEMTPDQIFRLEMDAAEETNKG
jgi:Uma2 family endonuclease